VCITCRCSTRLDQQYHTCCMYINKSIGNTAVLDAGKQLHTCPNMRYCWPVLPSSQPLHNLKTASFTSMPVPIIIHGICSCLMQYVLLTMALLCLCTVSNYVTACTALLPFINNCVTCNVEPFIEHCKCCG
jgi:hypothetical protein